MVKMRTRAVPWSAFRKAAPGGPVRVLTQEDTPALQLLVDADPVANVFMAALLAATPSAVPRIPGACVLGYFDDAGALGAACWLGSNVVPIGADEEQGRSFGRWIVAHPANNASIFGPRAAVLAIFEELDRAGIAAQEIRADQPLLELRGEPLVPPHPSLEISHIDQFPNILVAAAAMFEEEVGYSPYLGGEENYRRRVSSLIQQGHSFSHCDDTGRVIFKADLGAVSPSATQIQGVYLDPTYRGLGLSAAYMAAVVLLARRLAPVTSLYVNDYNTRARATYRRVGFAQVGTFATVLL